MERVRIGTLEQIPTLETKCIDDTFLWDNSIGNFFQAVQWLDICCKNGITLNIWPRFCCIHYYTRRFPQAIQEITVPKNITNIWLWIGLLNQCPKLSQWLQLLKQDTKFVWTHQLQRIFNAQLLIGQRKELFFGSYKNIGNAQKHHNSAIEMDGRSPSWAFGLRIQQNLVMHPLKVKQSLMLQTRHVSSFSALQTLIIAVDHKPLFKSIWQMQIR